MQSSSLPILKAAPVAPVGLFHLGAAPDRTSPVPRFEEEFSDPDRSGCVQCHFALNPTYELVNPAGCYYAVLDAAMDVELVFQAKSLGADPISLFVGEQAKDMLPVAPYFVVVPRGAPLLRSWAQKHTGNIGTLLDSKAAAHEVYLHLRDLFVVQDEEGEEYFFRFYDPRVLRTYLANATGQELQELFGPLRNLIVADASGEGMVNYSLDRRGGLRQTALGNFVFAETVTGTGK